MNRRRPAPKPKVLHRALIRLDLSADELPSEFLIWKVGLNTTSNGYDVLWDEKAAEATMAAYEKHGADLMIDLQHLSLDKESPNYDPDARGWCRLELRDGELWAVDVRWTPEGAERLRKKTQRYTSPAFLLDKESRCIEIGNIALVAMPGTDELPALVAASKKWQRLASGPSLGDITRAIGEALSERYPPDQSGPCYGGPWVCEVYQSTVVYELDGKLFEASYEYSGAAATIGDGVQVRRVYEPIAAPAAEEASMKIDAKTLGSAAARVRTLSKAGISPKTILKTLADGEGEGSGEIAGVDIAALADFLGIATNPAQDPAGFVKELMAKLEDISSRLRGDAPPKTEPEPEKPAEEQAASRVLFKILGAASVDEALIIATDWRKLALEDASEKARLAKEQQKLDDTKRRQLTARLVVCKSESPATAWEDDAKTIPAAHLRGMTLEALEKRAEHFESLAGVRKPLTADPKGSAAGETKTFQVNGHSVTLDARELKICEQQKCDPAVFAARKYPNGRKD